MSRVRRFGRILSLLGVMAIAPSCPSPSAPPHGPAEIPGPIAFDLPETVTIDISRTVSGSEEKCGSPIVSGGEFSDIIGSSLLTDLIQNILNRIVGEEGVLGNVEVAANAEIASLQTTVPSASVLFPGEEVKVDFSPFTSSREESDQCTGSTGGDLVCFRVWISGNQFLAGFLNHLPSGLGNGAGYLWFTLSHDLFQGFGEHPQEIFQVRLHWDHTNPADKTTELILGGDLSGLRPDSKTRIQIHQEGEEECQSIKTLSVTDQSDNSSSEEGDTFPTNLIGRWKEDEDFWSGKVIGTNEGLNESDICARFSTGNSVADDFCSLIQVDEEDFLALPDEEFIFPSDFPEEPTF